MPSSTASSIDDKWERTNLRLPAVAPNNYHRGNDDSLNSSATSATSGSSLTARASNHSPGSQEAEYLHLPPAIDSSSSSVTKEENQQHRSRVTSTQKLLQHFAALDRHLSSIPQLANSTRQLLSNDSGTHKKVKRITATNSGRIINVLQGEMAHCTPNQADVLVSDDATTCHILGLWSVSKRNSCSHSMQQSRERMIDQGKTILATIAHIDGPGYQDCIRDAVDLHYQHHSSQHWPSLQSELRGNNTNDEDTTVSTIPDIQLYIHLMGGYNDNEGTSHEITEGVLRALSNISNDYANAQQQQQQQQQQLQPRLQMILQTCAVSSSNDDGSRCPIGRGLALNVSSGQVYLAEVDEEEEEEDVAVVKSSTPFSSCLENNDATNVAAVTTSARGPDWILRHVRLWASLLGRLDLILRFPHLPPSLFEPIGKFCRTTSFYCIFWSSGRVVREPNFSGSRGQPPRVAKRP